ncbi:MAG: glycosyltransferase N-terminal domain-containing protein [Planctomycetota bacterium]|nr:glycosyltransferase N-terminal domain-containing protein [Planctomycetota bacterium]
MLRQVTGGAEQATPGPITSSPSVGLGRRALQMVYDVAIGLVWALMLPLFLVAGLARPRLARKALSLSTFGLCKLPPSAPRRERVLVHGVSVGEIKASQSLVHALSERYEVVVSAFSDTGMQVAGQLFPELQVVRYPFDFAPLVARFWRRVRPDFVLLVELEAWPCFLRAANRRGAPVAVVSGRITEQSFRRYKLFGALPEFGRVSLFAAQDEAYAARFAALAGSGERVLVTGNVKVDGLRGAREGPRRPALARLREQFGLRAEEASSFVIVAGSTHEPEELAFVEAARAALPEARLVLVPRHPERAQGVSEALSEALDEEPELLSELRLAGRSADPRRPLIVDTIGELEEIYGVADAVFIGGSLIPHGGQNMMEPAAQGVPVVYGPHVDNFLHETELLESAGAALRVPDARRLGSALVELAQKPELRQRMGEAGRRVLLAERGATGATLEALRARIGLA